MPHCLAQRASYQPRGRAVLCAQHLSQPVHRPHTWWCVCAPGLRPVRHPPVLEQRVSSACNARITDRYGRHWCHRPALARSTLSAWHGMTPTWPCHRLGRGNVRPGIRTVYARLRRVRSNMSTLLACHLAPICAPCPDHGRPSGQRAATCTRLSATLDLLYHARLVLWQMGPGTIARGMRAAHHHAVRERGAYDTNECGAHHALAVALSDTEGHARRGATGSQPTVVVCEHTSWPPRASDVRAAAAMRGDATRHERITTRISTRSCPGVAGATARLPYAGIPAVPDPRTA